MISNAYGSGGCQMGRPVVMMASADEGRAARPGRRQNLDNPTAPRQPQGLGVRLKQRAYAILCDPGRLFHFVSHRPDRLRSML
jgi:hypothetical protein